MVKEIYTTSSVERVISTYTTAPEETPWHGSKTSEVFSISIEMTWIHQDYRERSSNAATVTHQRPTMFTDEIPHRTFKLVGTSHERKGGKTEQKKGEKILWFLGVLEHLKIETSQQTRGLMPRW
jgi:hypothetical protein